MLKDPVTIVSQIADLVRPGPDPLGLYLSEREARSSINKTFPSVRSRRDAQQFLTELLSARHQPTAKMPQYAAKRKRPLGILATRNAKRAKTARDKYGGKSIDWNAAAKLADQAAASAVMRATETTYSQSGMYLDTGRSALTQTGFAMSGLNQSAAFSLSSISTRGNRTNGCLYWPLSPMAQVGNTNTPGYRKGQRINPQGFRVSMMHTQYLSTVNKVYHFALLRNKGVTLGGSPVSPGLSSTDGLSLFVPLSQGPLAAAGGPTGTLPFGDFSSCMRWNRQAWSVVKHGQYTMGSAKDLENAAVQNQPNTTGATATNTLHKSVYYPIKDVHWDYPTPTAISNIKGGDYFWVMWSEGAADLALGAEQIVFTMELSFKDP